jgi:hypothetical protein
MNIILDGDEVEPLRLLDIDGAVLVEIVDGQYRIEQIQEAVNVSTTSGAHDERKPR